MIKNTLWYLLNGTHNALPSSYTKLRSYLNTHSAILAEQHQYKVFKKNTQCPYCFTSWENDVSSFKLLPTKKFKSRKSIESDVAEESRNTLVLKCSVCKQRSTFSLVKKKYVQETPQIEEKTQKKKKRKKVRFYGLVVNSKATNKSNLLFTLKKKKKVPNKTKSSKQMTKKTKMKNQSKTPLNIPSKIKLNPKNKNKINPKNQFMLNPFSAQNQNTKKLRKLKNSLKQNDNAARKTLKDFLTPI